MGAHVAVIVGFTVLVTFATVAAQPACVIEKYCEDEEFRNVVIQDAPAVEFVRCSFRASEIRGDWTNAIFRDVIFLAGSILDIDFAEAQFDRVFFSSSIMEQYSFASASFVDTYFDRMFDGTSSLSATRSFDSAQLRSLTLSGVILPRLSIADVVQVTQQLPALETARQDLNFAIRGSDLKLLFARNADLQGARFVYSELQDADFSSANLAGATFKYSNLTGAQFENANLTSASGFSTATLPVPSETCEEFCESRSCSCEDPLYCASAGANLGPFVNCSDFTLFLEVINNISFNSASWLRVVFDSVQISGTEERVNLGGFAIRDARFRSVQIISASIPGAAAANSFEVSDTSLESVLFIDVSSEIMADSTSFFFKNCVARAVVFNGCLLRRARFENIGFEFLPDPEFDPFLSQLTENGFFGGELASASFVNVTGQFKSLQGIFLYPFGFRDVLMAGVVMSDIKAPFYITSCSVSDLNIDSSQIPQLYVSNATMLNVTMSGSSVNDMAFFNEANEILQNSRASFKASAMSQSSDRMTVRQQTDPSQQVLHDALFRNVDMFRISFFGIHMKNVTFSGLQDAGDNALFYLGTGTTIEGLYFRDSRLSQFEFQFRFGASLSDLLIENSVIFDQFLIFASVVNSAAWDNVRIENSAIHKLQFAFVNARNWHMRDSNFTSMMLSGGPFNASFSSCILQDAVFDAVDLLNSSFDDVTLLGSTRFTGSDVQYTSGLFDAGGCFTFCEEYGCNCGTEPTPEPTREPTPSPTPTSAPCFPADAIVTHEDGTQLRMDQLQVGDRIEVADGQFSEVFLFGHRDPEAKHQRFVEIKTVSGALLHISESHLVCVSEISNRGYEMYSRRYLVPARLVSRHHVVFSQHGRFPDPVDSVRVIERSGLYHPHTLSGSIVVNSVLVSCYAEIVHPAVAELLLLPVRIIYSMFGWNLLATALESGIRFTNPGLRILSLTGIVSLDP